MYICTVSYSQVPNKRVTRLTIAMSRIKDSTDKLTVGNGVNGVNMASRKASKHKIPSHVHLVAPTDESRKKESSWSEHTWSKYS